MNNNTIKDRISSLPQELADIIVNYLKGDKPSLSSCSLVCRKLLSTSRALLFERCVLHAGNECNTLLCFPETTLRCIKILRIPSPFASVSQEILNHPSFHRFMASLGPLELEVNSDSFSWSHLNDSARETLSAHPFRRIQLYSGSFQSVADICFFLRSSHNLETLILGTLKIGETSISHCPCQAGPSVSHLTVSSGEERLRLFQSIIATSCPITINDLRVLDVNISHAEDLGLLRGVLAVAEELQELRVSHGFLESHVELLPIADLNLTSIKSLTVKMSDYQDLGCPDVYPALFLWWCEVWANTKATSIEELVIRSTLDIYEGEFDTTLWSQIANTLSRPPWKTLSSLMIVICAPENGWWAESLLSPYTKQIEDIMTPLTLTETQSVDVVVKLNTTNTWQNMNMVMAEMARRKRTMMTLATS
ncbi:uncharacterized protein BT62DRAFT_933147 [Guyanagaster necrorhizus]|uniref:F-box domain-containing protein n=1 Tax=Guyanagaster necrorhizus TaxID=856835 RepID=A0A9P7VRU0_9AGAR|nr:uncharacterized protein BT62DRAFT_933147 [Guyanagaster necrorhizus MCA 3950]KAG7445305.1 hypothetical protein BT62DRAFT_933147 [Guyanagaster necrorhizus MCA 3950]